MQLQMTPEIDWLEVETSDGEFWIPKEEVGSARPVNVAIYVGMEPRDVLSVRELRGYGIRWSSPGYLDATEWDVHRDSDEAAEAAFTEMTDNIFSEVDDWLVVDDALSWDHTIDETGPGSVLLSDGEYGIAVISYLGGNIDVEEAKEIAADAAKERGYEGWHPQEVIDTPSASVFEEYQRNRAASCSPLSQRRGKWTTELKDALPDSHFLYVGKGGTKSAGRTHPLSLRKFPYKDKQGNLDVTHLRNALARISQSNLSRSEQRAVEAKAQKIYESCVGYAENPCPQRLCTGDKIEVWSAADGGYFTADMIENYGDGNYEIWFTEKTPEGMARRGRVHESVIRGFVENPDQGPTRGSGTPPRPRAVSAEHRRAPSLRERADRPGLQRNGMTKAEAVAEFREHYLPHISPNDRPARAEGWNNYTDMLQKDGRISMRQYEAWSQPF